MESISPGSPLRGSTEAQNYVPLYEFEKARRASLGNNTKCSSPYGAKNTVLGRVAAGFKDLKKHEKKSLNRALRFILQTAARNLHLSAVADDLGPIEALNTAHRVVKCHHTNIKPNIEIWKSAEHKKAFYAGVSVCGSVWVCPICAAKIQEKRRGEVAQAVDWAYDSGYTATMITFTFPHYGYQSCKELLEKQKLAFKYLRSGKVWQRIKADMGYQGLIRSLEVNYGANGWHPHTHEIWIHQGMTDRELQKISRAIHARWKQACKKFGLIPRGKTKAFDQYATDFKPRCSTSDYLLKLDDSSTWGVDREVVKSSSKSTKKGRPPFAILTDYAKGCKKSGALFLEYSEAFKGKSQLFWSQGLKDKVGLNDKTDEELAEEKEDDADKVIAFETFGWLEILKADARHEVLELAESGGYNAVYDWLIARGVTDAGFSTW